MLVVPTELRSSVLHGTGLFLLKPVKKGELIWRFDSRVDRVYSESEVASLPVHVQDSIKTYACWHKETSLWVWYGDNGRYINHADPANTESIGSAFGDDVASVDMHAGTELTTNYFTICDMTRTTGKL